MNTITNSMNQLAPQIPATAPATGGARSIGDILVEAGRRKLVAGQRIEQESGEPITVFSYPIGQPWSFNADSMSLAREAGYQYAFSFYPGYSTYRSDKFDMRRVAVEPRIQLQEIKAVVQMPRFFTL